MANLNAWELVKQSRFAEACKAADRDYAKTGQIYHLGNKIYALLNMAKFSEAKEACSELPGGKPTTAGVILWLMGKPSDAVQAWRAGREAKYTDAAGGISCPILMHYAAIRLNDASLRLEAISSVADVLKNPAASNWPGPLGAYVMGRLNEQDVLANLSEQPILRDRELCAANFHFGVKSFGSDHVRFIKQMSLAVEGVPSIMLEPQYYLAKGELVREGLAKWAS